MSGELAVKTDGGVKLGRMVLGKQLLLKQSFFSCECELTNSSKCKLVFSIEASHVQKQHRMQHFCGYSKILFK